MGEDEKTAVKIEDIDHEVFNKGLVPEPIQPESNDAIEELRKRVADVMYDAFIARYGGPNRCYERFLVARDWDLDKAEKMIRHGIEFRQERNLDGDRGAEELERVAEYQAQVGPLWILRNWGLSTEGYLLIYGRISKVDLKRYLEIPEDNIKSFYLEWLSSIFEIQNYSNAFVRDPKDPEWKGNVSIINLQGISMSQLHISGLRLLNRVLKIAQGIAPENTSKVYLVNAPWFFSGAWSIIKRALNKNVLEKITVSSGDCKEEIMKYFGHSEEMYQDFFNSVQ